MKRFASVTPALTTEPVLFAFIKEVLFVGLADRVPKGTCSYAAVIRLGDERFRRR